MTKLFIENLPIQGKRVLMRVDFNVPLDGDGNILDATRIEASLPSIRFVLEHGGALILMSHLGRPHNAPNPELSLKPCALVLSALLNHPVQMAPDCIGRATHDLVQNLRPGDILLLENLRFHRAEQHPDEDPDFARELASYGDFYVNDAFGTAHRHHSSTVTITAHFPDKAAAGYLLQKELSFLDSTLTNPKRPFVALIGGAKISTKIGVIKTLVKKVDTLLIGGGMAYTFLKAKGIPIGNSIYEEELVTVAEELLEEFPITLPIDLKVAPECSDTASTQIVTQGVPDGHEGLDIGPQTIDLFSEKLRGAKTILWNGPVGVFEFDAFAAGTFAMAHAIADSDATSIVGGGESIAALAQADVTNRITHISTGGGATLEYLEHGTLPGIEALTEISVSA